MFATSIRKFFVEEIKLLRLVPQGEMRKHRSPSRADCKIRPNLLFMQYSPQLVHFIIFNEILSDADYNQFNIFCSSGLQRCF